MIPKLLTQVEQLFPYSKGKKLAFFLDYDGTLTPIVARPELAILTKEAREALFALSKQFLVAIISGRDLKDIEALVGLNGIIYAGSHGFDIKGESYSFEESQAVPFIKEIGKAASLLRKNLEEIKGVIVEEKKFAVAAHYRLVEEKDLPRFFASFEKVHREFAFLRKKEGKKVLELQPDIDWDKGKALKWLLEKLGYKEEEYLPIFIGDDVTDEDAFFVLRGCGVGICVMETPKESFAPFYLRNCKEVYAFFSALSKAFSG